ncbi:hypothetical protein D3C80_2049770 [compost metagenome]
MTKRLMVQGHNMWKFIVLSPGNTARGIHLSGCALMLDYLASRNKPQLFIKGESILCRDEKTVAPLSSVKCCLH